MQSDERSAAQGASANQSEPTVPHEEDIGEADSAVGGVRSSAYDLSLLDPAEPAL